jgi:uncharacterized protein (TIGR03435 family)
MGRRGLLGWGLAVAVCAGMAAQVGLGQGGGVNPPKQSLDPPQRTSSPGTPVDGAPGLVGAASAALAAYDVVSVKPVQPTRLLFVGLQELPDGISSETVTVAMLVQSAYGDRSLATAEDVTGLPGWAKSDYFSVQAKMSAEQVAAFAKLSKDEKEHQRALMLRALLADRCKLKVHRETRQVLGYALVVAKGGPKFRDTPDPNTPLGPNGKPLRNSMRIVPSNGGQEVIVQNFTMEQLAMFLTGNAGVNHRVVDKTGLTGRYNYTLTFALPQGAGPAGQADATAPDPAPTLFNALEDQLGLHLQRGTETVDTVVVEHVERPAAN